MIKDRRNQELAKSMAAVGRTAPCVCSICRRRVINKHGDMMWRYPDHTLLHKRCWQYLRSGIIRRWVRSAGQDMRTQQDRSKS